jgi:putative peptide zinc metalloprotease protein
MDISLSSQLEIKNLNIYKDQKNFIVEDPHKGEFYEMPQICIDAIEMIQQGLSLGDIESRLKHDYPDEQVDMIDFVYQLYELGLIQKIDGIPIEQEKEEDQAQKNEVVFPPFVGKLFFNTISKYLYALLFVVNIMLFFVFPELFPHYEDLFIFDSMMLNMLTWSGLSLIVVIIHEFGHLLAVRARGLPAKLGISHRLFLVVFETDMSHVWKLPPRERNILYLAGLCFDQVSLFAALSLQLILPEEWALFKGMLGVMVFDIVIKMLYQCCFYMKTDLYYVFENVTGCYNLMENAQWWLKKRLPFLRAEGKGDVFAGEERIIRYYSLFYAAGVFITLAIFIFYILPQTIHSYMRSLANLSNPVNSPYFWDGVTFLVLSTLMIGLLLYSMAKKYRYRT